MAAKDLPYGANSKNRSATATGTKFHPNNQVKADHKKKASPFVLVLKDYTYKGGEITKWFVDYWDHFSSFEEAVNFMAVEIEAKRYRAFCF